ncbi:DUF1405 domain-containing protein [Alkalicoccobacillus porphyridii]|uniref:DUF1405 domain-containing protein n=1 Tax=Alkalicoccobacillus porphyridii TaxID=2597270 RepID=A0A554A0E7_9BACI|nr:DUF1405 domain-containing protein [Alkalicoccobacillus porphyridii]TSB47172.1 DUF1405 domain-containing protein [Alkalicoccobacillus porphyridii]
MLQAWLYFFSRRTVIWLLLLINVPGTIYGFIWYWNQLKATPWYFVPFVPDSPTASLFFVFVLIAFLLRTNWPLMEALAGVTLIKYGIWAVVMNSSAVLAGAPLSSDIIMLNLSHAGMALQAIIYAPFFRLKAWHLVAAAVWTVHNDIIDYVFGMFPWLSQGLLPYLPQIGYFTFLLGLFSVGMIYLLSLRKDRLILSVHS